MGAIDSLILNKIKYDMNKQLVADERAWETEMGGIKRSLDLQGQFLKNAVMMGDTQTVERNRKAFEESFGKQNVQIATDRAQFLKQLMGMGAYNPEEFQKESAETKQAEMAEQGDLIESEQTGVMPSIIEGETPARFQKEEGKKPERPEIPIPDQEFVGKAPVGPTCRIGETPRKMKNMHVGPGGISFDIKEDSPKMDARDSMLINRFISHADFRNLAPLERVQGAILKTAELNGRLPSQTVLSQYGSDNMIPFFEQVFYRLAAAYRKDPENILKLEETLQDANVNILRGSPAFKSLLRKASVRFVAHGENGMNWMPDDLREGLREKEAETNLSPKVLQALELMGITDSTTASTDQKWKAIGIVNEIEAIRTKMAATAGTKARLRATFAVEPEKPISQKERADRGVPPEIKTAGDLVKAGWRFASASDGKAFNEVGKIQTTLESLESYAFGDEDYKGIFTSKDDKISRGKHAAYLLKEREFGTALGIRVATFQARTKLMGRVIVRLAEEGKITDEDAEAGIKSIPNVGNFFTEFPDGKGVAAEKMKELNRYIQAWKINLAQPKMVKMGAPQKKPPKISKERMDEMTEIYNKLKKSPKRK